MTSEVWFGEIDIEDVAGEASFGRAEDLAAGVDAFATFDQRQAVGAKRRVSACQCEALPVAFCDGRIHQSVGGFELALGRLSGAEIDTSGPAVSEF